MSIPNTEITISQELGLCAEIPGGLHQEMLKINLKHLVIPENKNTIDSWDDCAKKSQEPTCRSFHFTINENSNCSKLKHINYI